MTVSQGRFSNGMPAAQGPALVYTAEGFTAFVTGTKNSLADHLTISPVG